MNQTSGVGSSKGFVRAIAWVVAASAVLACTSGPILQAPPAGSGAGTSDESSRMRARDAGVVVGSLPPGKWNAITDVPGVRVGHATLVQGNQVRTGVTVVLPHRGNLMAAKVPAAIVVANGYGKLVGISQVRELGQLESPIALTNTLSVGRVMDALVAHSLSQPGNQDVRSVNVVVGETNDGRLNDIRGRHVTAREVLRALAAADTGPVREGAVGAGTGTVCFGWKGGIGTSSRRVRIAGADYRVGVLVQTNFGGDLTIDGRSMAGLAEESKPRRRAPEDGSCMIVVATDAPLGSSKLERLARRAFVGMARTGASFSNGSGDYAIAFSTDEALRTTAGAPREGGATLAADRLSPLFRAVAEATEEAILNSLFTATTTTGCDRTVRALPLDRVRSLLGR